MTELVTGIDLVHAQLRVAAGERLPWRQEEISQRGHALECRVYAEDPARDFLPQAGMLLMYREPAAPGIRIDAGVVEGGEVSVFYDPLLAKLIAYAETRDAAINRATDALRRFIVLGIHTNIACLARIVDSEQFRAADIHTGFLDQEGRAMCESKAPELSEAVQAALAFHHDTTRGVSAGVGSGRASDPFDSIRGWSVK